MKRHSKSEQKPQVPQPDQAILKQRTAHQWQELTEKQVEVVALLRATAVQQRELIAWWEAMDASGGGNDAKALEDRLQQLLFQMVELVQNAMAHEKQCIQDARLALAPQTSASEPLGIR